jgi:predicted enzyme related to lactoylglutathione lyase
MLAMEITTHTPGSFCTAILRTRDLERAATFYSALIGWTAEEVPGTPGHRLLQFGGRTVASVHEITEGSDVWVPHVSVESVERTTSAALTLGGTVVDTSDVPGLARLATIRDPEGTVFGLWEPAPHQGAQLTEVVGSLWWIEVLWNDVAAAREFYGRLFGWTSVDTSFEPFASYTVFRRGDVQEGGILPIDPDWRISPRWNSIFAMEDCDAAIERAKTLGGEPVFVHTVPKHGRIGVLCDPGGALFVIRGPVPAVIS